MISEERLQEIKSCVIADIESHAEWREEVERGKMFGFLIGRKCDTDEEVILKAYSGQINGRSDWEGYVPAIFDYLQPGGYFKTHELRISNINNRIKEAEAQLEKGQRSHQVETLKAERKVRSQALQHWLFEQFMLVSPQGDEESVLRVFTDYAHRQQSKQVVPPGGTAECCAPKLLNYANMMHYEPLAVAEFWYGASPKGEIRHHGKFYEPCQSKCMPILWYLAPDDSIFYPFIRQTSAREIKIIYEDEWFAAIDKPSGLLSVPGKRQLPNAEDMLREMLPQCSFLKMVHRLDMDTSGVLLAAKTEEAYKAMMKLFADHELVRKEYVARLTNTEGKPMDDSGVISLPLSADFMNRPRQIVDYEKGKEAITRFVRHGDMVHLFPLTGRTHQLRMHCAHPDGLDMPILGDPLYGNVSADRMYLHALQLQFMHPMTGKETCIQANCSISPLF